MYKNELVRQTSYGLYCEQGRFFIDPSRAVDNAVITHAHSDHARPGSRSYLSVKESALLLKCRIGNKINLQTAAYNEPVYINGVRVSFHPAGHILGSAQVRLEWKGNVCVISGDYKTEHDDTCAVFETIKCNTFITESTFALPVYKWKKQQEIFNEINGWWYNNSRNDVTSVIFAYSLGKAQRILSGLDSSLGNIYCHGAVKAMNDCYRDTGINLPGTICTDDLTEKNISKGGIVITPPVNDLSLLTKIFGEISVAFASGWTQLRSYGKRSRLDKGFILSDHADWDELIKTIKDTGAEKIFVTHGYSGTLVRWLRENGWNADVLRTS